jgi:hypothetical protein
MRPGRPRGPAHCSADASLHAAWRAAGGGRAIRGNAGGLDDRTVLPAPRRRRQLVAGPARLCSSRPAGRGPNRTHQSGRPSRSPYTAPLRPTPRPSARPNTNTPTNPKPPTPQPPNRQPQTEGATASDGRGPSVWDVYVKQGGKIRDGSTADVACDHYNRYKEDIALMKSLGIKNFRFSISWSRLIPSGRKGGAVNAKGVEFYNNLINEMLKNGISPAVTL